MMKLSELAASVKTEINEKSPQKSPVILVHLAYRIQGLSDSEATSRLLANGRNQLTPKKQTHPAIKFLLQFVAFFPLLLELAGVLCLIAYFLDRNGVENVC